MQRYTDFNDVAIVVVNDIEFFGGLLNKEALSSMIKAD